MALHKLTSTEAFIVTDFDDAPAVGTIRLAKKILQRGAWEMARSQTYRCALLGLQMGGASGGINAEPGNRQVALDAFSEELMPRIAAGELFLDPGKGVGTNDFAALAAADNRSDATTQAAVEQLVAGTIAAVDAVAPLEGKTVCIEGFGDTGPSLSHQIESRGGRVAAISTSAGFARVPEQVGAGGLAEQWSADAAGIVSALSDGDPAAGHMAMGAECDVLLVGSKMGALDHRGAAHVKASTVAAHTDVPMTTKAAVMLERAGTTVIPDIVTLLGPLSAAFGTAGSADPADAAAAVAAVTTELKNHDQGLMMGAFLQAESFMKTWRDTLPFGRPFAA